LQHFTVAAHAVSHLFINKSAMDAKQQTLRVEIPELPVLLEVDPVRMTQVLTHLLTNAAKYTPAGGLITIGGRLELQELTLFVRDNGAGIAPAMLPQIFDMFTQVKPTGRPPKGVWVSDWRW
jgi:signal transduction histidine kinase